MKDCKVKLTTKINEMLFSLAKEKAEKEGLSGVNEVIEKALKLYFSNCDTTVWERKTHSGWIRKLVVRPKYVTVETIRGRKSFSKYDRGFYTDDVLSGEGWRQVWKMKSNSGKVEV